MGCTALLERLCSERYSPGASLLLGSGPSGTGPCPKQGDGSSCRKAAAATERHGNSCKRRAMGMPVSKLSCPWKEGGSTPAMADPESPSCFSCSAPARVCPAGEKARPRPSVKAGPAFPREEIPRICHCFPAVPAAKAGPHGGRRRPAAAPAAQTPPRGGRGSGKKAYNWMDSPGVTIRAPGAVNFFARSRSNSFPGAMCTGIVCFAAISPAQRIVSGTSMV